MSFRSIALRGITAILLLLAVSLSLVAPLVNPASAAMPVIRTEKLVFELWSLPWFPQSDKAADVIAEQLKAIGIKVEVRRLESAVMYPKIQNFEFQVYALATSQSPNPIGMIESFHSKYCQPGIGSFWCHADPDVDRMIEDMMSATSPERVRELALKIQERLAYESGFIPIYLTQSVKVIRAEWKNYTVMPGGPLEVYDIWSILYMYKSDKPEENVLRIAFPSDILTLNPFQAVDLRSLWIINLIYDPLFRLDKDLKVVPWLVKSWEESPDKTVYTLRLREDVKWHDGKPLTADDVVYTFSEGMRQNTSRYIGLKDIVKSVEKVDDYTVKFTLYKPNPFFILMLATGYYYIVPKHVIEGVDLKTWKNDNPIGSGPFKFVKRVVGESIVLDRNENFWIKGTPKITRVIMRVIPEAESRFLAIRNNEVDTERYDTLITLIPQAERDPNLKVVTAPGIWLVYIAFNTKNFFYDPKVFEAINYAINREEVVKKANGGYGYPVYTVLNKYWHGDLAAQIEFKYDPERAKRLLEEAGWRDIDGDGIREYVGVTTTQPQTTSPTTPTTMLTSPTTPLTPSPTVETTTPTGISTMAVAAVIIVLIAIVGVILLLRRRS